MVILADSLLLRFEYFSVSHTRVYKHTYSFCFLEDLFINFFDVDHF